MFTIKVKKSVKKRIAKAPETIQILFDELTEDLEEKGPIQKQWPNFSKLGEDQYHCHLKYSWVACWYHAKGSIEIEVYYAGSREDAPY
jgi:hypothetical protein